MTVGSGEMRRVARFPVDSSLRELGRRLRRRQLSSLELTRAVVERLTRIGPRWNAVAEVTHELAERQARRADRRLADSGPTSPLLGIPYGVKDVLATAGLPTRLGSDAFRAQIFDYDATVVSRLRSAGAPLVGKLAMVEFSGAGGYRHASASANGAGLNPWNADRWSGGSSSGSAIAVAARLVPFAIGGETIGSILIPAAFCGVTGFRPSSGAVSLHGAIGLSWSMDKIGPLAKSVDDCSLVFAAICGPDPRDPATKDWAPRASKWSDLVLGVPDVDRDLPSATAKAFQRAVDVLRRSGLTTRRIVPPDHEYTRVALTIMAAEIATTHRRFLKSRALALVRDGAQRRGLRRFLDVSLGEYGAAVRARAAAASDLRAMFKEVDAIVLPTMPDEAPPVDADLRTDLRLGPGPAMGSLAGLPGLSIPMGYGRHGMPLGLSILADVGADALVLRIGRLFQQATDWHEQHPTVDTG